MVHLSTDAAPEDKKAHPVEDLVVEANLTGSAIDEVPDGGLHGWLIVFGVSFDCLDRCSCFD